MTLASVVSVLRPMPERQFVLVTDSIPPFTRAGLERIRTNHQDLQAHVDSLLTLSGRKDRVDAPPLFRRTHVPSGTVREPPSLSALRYTITNNMPLGDHHHGESNRRDVLIGTDDEALEWKHNRERHQSGEG